MYFQCIFHVLSICMLIFLFHFFNAEKNTEKNTEKNFPSTFWSTVNVTVKGMVFIGQSSVIYATVTSVSPLDSSEVIMWQGSATLDTEGFSVAWGGWWAALFLNIRKTLASHLLLNSSLVVVGCIFCSVTNSSTPTLSLKGSLATKTCWHVDL